MPNLIRRIPAGSSRSRCTGSSSSRWCCSSRWSSPSTTVLLNDSSLLCFAHRVLQTSTSTARTAMSSPAVWCVTVYPHCVLSLTVINLLSQLAINVLTIFSDTALLSSLFLLSLGWYTFSFLVATVALTDCMAVQELRAVCAAGQGEAPVRGLHLRLLRLRHGRRRLPRPGLGLCPAPR